MLLEEFGYEEEFNIISNSSIIAALLFLNDVVCT